MGIEGQVKNAIMKLKVVARSSFGAGMRLVPPEGLGRKGYQFRSAVAQRINVKEGQERNSSKQQCSKTSERRILKPLKDVYE